MLERLHVLMVIQVHVQAYYFLGRKGSLHIFHVHFDDKYRIMTHLIVTGLMVISIFDIRM